MFRIKRLLLIQSAWVGGAAGLCGYAVYRILEVTLLPEPVDPLARAFAGFGTMPILLAHVGGSAGGVIAATLRLVLARTNASRISILIGGLLGLFATMPAILWVGIAAPFSAPWISAFIFSAIICTSAELLSAKLSRPSG